MQYILSRFYNADAKILWHGDAIHEKYDLLVIPGGFSYGDYLRAGAIARFAPAMKSLKEHAEKGGPVMGICNGFQILCEAELLPGVLIQNTSLKHIAKSVPLNVAGTAMTSGLNKNKIYNIPVSHSEGNYRNTEAGLKELQDRDLIAFRYAENPNGSMDDIAGIVNAGGNIIGMMPHPERAADPVNGETDGKDLLDSILNTIL
jgi:phosphoribosylformylglycinamidine synthase